MRGCAWGVTKLEEEPAEVTRAIVRATLGGSASDLPRVLSPAPRWWTVTGSQRQGHTTEHMWKGECGAERQQFNNNWHSLNTLLNMVDLLCRNSEGHAFS